METSSEILVTGRVVFYDADNDNTYPTKAHVDALMDLQEEALRPYLAEGPGISLVRLWVTYQAPHFNHGHMALWTAPSTAHLCEVYDKLPLVLDHRLVQLHYTDLHAMRIDPGAPARRVRSFAVTTS
jgi:hypothetical protein